MKLSEIKGEQSLDVLADILDPIGEIVQDKEVRDLLKENKLKGVALAIKTHKQAVIEILARLDGEEPDKYEINLLTVPKKVLEILNDDTLATLF